MAFYDMKNSKKIRYIELHPLWGLFFIGLPFSIEVVSILLMRLNLPSINQNSKEKMAMTLLKDSQQGSDLASLDEYVLTGLDERLITRAVHLHEVVEDVDYRLPGLITGSVNAKTTPSLEESNYE